MDIKAKSYTPALSGDAPGGVAPAMGFLPPGQVRVVKIPDFLTDENLARLDADGVLELIRQHGAALGCAALIKLAAGVGGTPAATQERAAARLIDIAAKLAEDEKRRESLPESLRNLPRDYLVQLIADLERAQVAKTGCNIPDVLQGDSATPAPDIPAPNDGLA